MTMFTNGPAQGQRLTLKRAPIFLRVVEVNGKWDALDQLSDKPEPSEKVYAYKIVGKPSWCHIRASRGQGGFFTIAEYQLFTAQPTDAQMRDNAAWSEWCHKTGA